MGNLRIASSEVAEKFQKKLGQVKEQEKEVEAMRLAATLGWPHISLEKFPISQQALRQMSREEAARLGAVCFFATQDEIRVGALDPQLPAVPELLFQLQERNHANGVLYVISRRSLDRVLALYDKVPVIKPVTKDIEIHPEDLAKVAAEVNDFRSLQGLLDQKTATDMLTLLLGAALKLGASDMHVEAEEKGIAVRLRLDGLLHDVAALPKEAYKKLISRIKLISSLKINITATPQDGRFTMKLAAGEVVDVRVSAMPTVFGESIVMRLLPQSRGGLSLNEIGVTDEALVKLNREIDRPNGMIITTGPTGSGKTTTMYAILQMLNEPGVKIITLEDPVEYRIENVNQSQIDRSKDYTFAKGLRSMLRQDPDIAMVGEIRDLETADIAIQAALTGHLILSTIHTNSAAGAIPRFLSMGVKPYLLAPALNCVIGQRLVRRLCAACKKPAPLAKELAERVEAMLVSLPGQPKTREFFVSAGCEKCHGLGYKGRVGIYEVLVMSPAIEQLILGGQVSEYEIEKIAVADGMITMVQDGIIKALSGVTSVEEVFRVIE